MTTLPDLFFPASSVKKPPSGLAMVVLPPPSPALPFGPLTLLTVPSLLLEQAMATPIDRHTASPEMLLRRTMINDLSVRLHGAASLKNLHTGVVRPLVQCLARSIFSFAAF